MSPRCALAPYLNGKMDSPTKKKNQQQVAEESMETADSCEITRLPEELLSAVISRTSPRDACRASAVSLAFRAAADSDAVWSTFLPRNLPPLADGELSKKGLYFLLSDHGFLFPDGLMRFWLDRETGAKCYMLSARALHIVGGDTPRYWRWIPLTDSRFSEVAELLKVFWLEIRGKIHSKMLSQNSTYAAYMVFKMADESYGLDYPFQEASVSVGENRSTRLVCLQGYDMSVLQHRCWRTNGPTLPRENVQLRQERSDGWMELEMGEFYNEESVDGEVCISLMGTDGGQQRKKGLIVQGIEIRPKKSG